MEERGFCPPLEPTFEERKWIKGFYDKTGLFLLIHLGIALGVEVVAGIIGFLILAAKNGFNFYFMFENMAKNSGFQVLIAAVTLLSYLAANLAVFFFGCKSTKINPAPLFNFNFSAKAFFAAVAVALGLQAGCLLFGSLFLEIFPKETMELIKNITGQNRADSGLAWGIMTLYTCMVAPITEELVFRVFCLKNLSRVNLRFGIIASSLLFGLVHGNIIQFVFAFPLGIILALLTVRTNSIIPAIGVHMVANTCATILSKLSTSGFTWSETAALLWIAFAIAAGAAVLIAAKAIFKVSLPKAGEFEKRRGWEIYFSSGTIIAFTCIYGIMILATALLILFAGMILSFLK
ncbi:MAG: CPBP family intramembrane metalloprotease [Oscillospiraceae bacterium]|nr:CPBP family intramembrane metalloprotease [Oscillospiraceae bacterium]